MLGIFLYILFELDFSGYNILMSSSWHSVTAEKVIDELVSFQHGLSETEAAIRLERYGPNSLPESRPPSLLRLFVNQFNSPLIYILFGAAAVIFAMGEVADSAIIFAVLIFNAIVGTIQEGRAQNTLRALRHFVETQATVLRGASELIIADRGVVPGDIIILREGEKVPADARLISVQNLKIDEASLTGESEPVFKTPEVVTNVAASPIDQRNMAFKGTNVTSGSGRAIVVATGGATIIGRIAKEISTMDTEIPLKANIRYLSRAIIMVVGILSTALFAVGMLLGKGAREMFTTVVSLAVSIIPEGLPVVITLVLATGVWRMSRRNALVKKLQAVEALGQARVIAVDKTGTITRNELVVRKVWVDGKMFDVGGVGYDPHGDIILGNDVVDAANHEELIFAGKVAALTAGANLSYMEAEKRWRVSGDPTEAALTVFSEKVGFKKEDLLRESALIAELPFDYRLKYRAAVHGDDRFMTVIGAPEVLMSLSDEIRQSGKKHPLTSTVRNSLESVFIGLSEAGYRVIACAVKSDAPTVLKPESVKALTFVGFFAMKDAIRPEVKEAMSRSTSAGIRVVMVTGDHRITAKAIATEAGIYHDGDDILTGEEVDGLTDSDLSARLSRVSVFARVTPEHKLRIVTAYKSRGEIIAMTGDGVNDAPSLVAADLGVAMGGIGTEVAKEAADIILLDDNFGSIVSAVEEGRSIYRTIKKVILYLFSTSAGEVLTIVGAIVLGYPLPILASQIIWLNFVTDGFLTVALAMEPKEEGLLSDKFEHPKKYLVDRPMVIRMVLMAIPMMIGTLYLFKNYFEMDMATALTMSLTTLAVFQWFNAWNCRSDKKSVFSINPFSNMYLVVATMIVIALQFAAVYTPFMQKILHTVPLTLSDWLLIIPVAATIIVVDEIRKIFVRA